MSRARANRFTQSRFTRTDLRASGRRMRLHPKRGVAQDGKAAEVNTATQLAATHFQCVSALCEYQVSPTLLENALRSDQLQCQPVSVAAGFAADRLAHHLHVEEICRAETRA
jgi:hypothetical protein